MNKKVWWVIGTLFVIYAAFALYRGTWTPWKKVA